jgi:ribonucleotide reductase alpha subunit
MSATIHLKGKFGFSRVVIDHTYYVFTCKIMITESALPIIQGVKANFIETKKGQKRVLLTYCTMDYAEHERMQKAIVQHLEQHAIKKIKAKYAWATDEQPKKTDDSKVYHFALDLLDDDSIPTSWEDDLV